MPGRPRCCSSASSLLALTSPLPRTGPMRPARPGRVPVSMFNLHRKPEIPEPFLWLHEEHARPCPRSWRCHCWRGHATQWRTRGAVPRRCVGGRDDRFFEFEQCWTQPKNGGRAKLNYKILAKKRYNMHIMNKKCRTANKDQNITL
jgi:hypothetical protein